jgi:hypothetical protein
VALAEDGRVVRLLEDLVTQDLGLVQQVRSAAKVASLVQPRPAVELSQLNLEHAGRVRDLLGGLAMGGYTVVEEVWEGVVEVVVEVEAEVEEEVGVGKTRKSWSRESHYLPERQEVEEEAEEEAEAEVAEVEVVGEKTQ